jgi:NAD(P)-dependent dehydrogenase (short-subunit alcohol dehydrogenase family)
MAWTASDIPDQRGRRAVITGATSGIGEQTATALADAGASVILAARNPEKIDATTGRIRAAVPDADLDAVELDLADLTSVRVAAERLRDAYDRIDLLINNAGVMATPYRQTLDGFELQFGTNHLGHFALDGLLADRVLASDAARVVTVSSGAHKMGSLRFDDLDWTRGYQKWKAYGQSKLANLLFTFELQRRLDEAGASTIAVAAHPGFAATNLASVGPRMAGQPLVERLMGIGSRLLAQPGSQGALPTLYAATAPDVAGNDYFGPDGLLEMRGHPTRVSRSAAAKDPADARRLWTVSEELTGVQWPDVADTTMPAR